jgi:hypothetical protein
MRITRLDRIFSGPKQRGEVAMSLFRACASSFASVIAAVLLAAAPTFAKSFSPQGTQQVLVILLEFPTDKSKLCPNSKLPCGTPGQIAAIGKPRHTASEWQTLFNDVPASYWADTTYNQTKLVFTVLNNAETADGWWPAPHSFQDYARNGGSGPWQQWYQNKNTPPTYAMVPDAVASVAQNICGNPLLFVVCGALPSFNRLIVMSNFHSFGGQTLGNGYQFQIATGTKLGNLTVTASAVTEDSTDAGITVPLHELGHQFGDLSHYGDCSWAFTVSSFNPTVPSGPIQCLGYGWDIMGFSYDLAQLSGYTRVSRGWIKPSSTVTLDLAGTFSKTVTLNPLEVPPTKNAPNVIRLPYSDPSWPTYTGYYVECREAIGSDANGAFPSIPCGAYATCVGGSPGALADEGVLITNVHESSYPAHHVERPLSPSDQIETATLKPGDSFSSGGLSVKFDGYVPDTSPAQCKVSVANNPRKPIIPPPFLQYGGYMSLDGPVQPGDSVSIATDIALNNLLAANSVISLPIPVTPVWVEHQNLLSVRVHNRTPAAAAKVSVAVSASQPAVITDLCDSAATSPTLATVVLPSVAAGSSAVAHFPWSPGNPDSVSISATATGPANQITASSSFAYQFHHLGNQAGGIASTFLVAENDRCMMPETYYVGPAVQIPGWQVSVVPQIVSLNPGESKPVSVEVVPPASAQAGQHAEIPIVVMMQMLMGPSGNQHGSMASGNPAGLHYMTVGALSILARVTSGPGAIQLNVSDQGSVNFPLRVSGAITPADAASPITIEYRSPSGKTTTHVVVTNANGAYTDTFTPTQAGNWTVQSWWPGDSAHDPVESSISTIVVKSPA